MLPSITFKSFVWNNCKWVEQFQTYPETMSWTNRLAKSAFPNCKLYSHTAGWITGALLGFTWKSVLPWQLHILSFKKKLMLSTTLITDQRTTWLLVEIPWSNVTLAWALIWPSPHIYHEKHFQVSKLSIASEIQPLSWDHTHTDTHFHHIKYALGKLAIGLGRRPGVIC